MVVNIACFHSYEMFSCGIDGAIKPWYWHRGQINWEGTRWERKILTKQLEGGQENKKERRAIMSYTSGLPSSWRWTSSATVALLGQGSVCFDCRCKRDCQGITTTPISSCIMHACSAYFFQRMAKQQKPVRVEGPFYMCSRRSLTDNVQRASKEFWSKCSGSCSCKSMTERFSFLWQWSNVSGSQLDKSALHQ